MATLRFPREVPLAGYVGLIAVFVVLVGSAVAIVLRFGGGLDTATVTDVILLGISVHVTSHLASRDRITAPLRAFFTRFEKAAGAGEVDEAVASAGSWRAVGELVTCPYCLVPWMTVPLGTLFLLRPSAARILFAAFVAMAIARALHQLYAFARRVS